MQLEAKHRSRSKTKVDPYIRSNKENHVTVTLREVSREKSLTPTRKERQERPKRIKDTLRRKNQVLNDIKMILRDSD